MLPRLVAVALLAVAASGCQTGIGRALTHAFSGTPPEVVAAHDQVEAEYLRLSLVELNDIAEGKADTPEGKARKGRLLTARIAQQAAVLEGLRLLREHAGAESAEAAAASRAQAMARQAELAILARDLALGGL